MSYFSLLPSTLITIGVKKSCVVDIEKSFYCQIPNTMAIFFKAKRKFDIEKELKSLNNEEKEIFEDYISFLTNHNFGMIHDSKKIAFRHFKETDLYISPFSLESMIIDANSKEDLLYYLSFLPNTQITNHLQLRLFFCPEYSFLLLLAQKLDYLRLELIIQNNSAIKDSDYQVLLSKYSSTISKIVVMSATQNMISENKKLFYTTEKLTGSNQCGKIRKSMFMTNIESFLISCSGNSCLFKKISIDSLGYIKNCPSMKKSYGHISEVKLEDVLINEEFKKYWYIQKIDIDVCRVCEFRDICTDCRAFIKDPNNVFSQPKKCDYNPYIAKWKGEANWVSIDQWRIENTN